MKKEALLTVLLLFGMASVAQTEVTTYTPGVSTEGVVYYLPKTAVNVNITIEKTNYTPGELCQYADRYLRINNISSSEDSHYSIKSISLDAEGIPDTSKAYHIKFTSKSVAPLVTLNESGILLSINATNLLQEEKSVPTIPNSNNKSLTINPRDFMTEEMLMTGSKAKLAELAAKEIYNIRESRNLLLRGQNENTPKDGEAIRIILDGMKKQEDALLQLFTGTTTTELSTQIYQVIPNKNAEKIVLGRFSRKLGLLHPDDLAGMPIYIDIKESNSVSEPIIGPQSGKKSKSKSKSTLKLKKEKDNRQDGVVYNIPEKANIKVYTNSETLVEASMPISQFGNIETLSVTSFSKKNNIKVFFSPTTGALLKMEEQTN